MILALAEEIFLGGGGRGCLGLITAIYSKEQVRDLSGRPLDTYVQSDTGMMGVIPAWRLVEMFEFPDMRSLLETEREEANRQQAESTQGRFGRA